MASRKKRGSVPFRPRLLTDLALSLLPIMCSRRLVGLLDRLPNLDILHRQERPLLAVSGPSFHMISKVLNGRFR